MTRPPFLSAAAFRAEPAGMFVFYAGGMLLLAGIILHALGA